MKIRNYLLIAFLIFSCIGSPLLAQLGTTVSVQGNLILGPCGDTLLLRGMNYSPYNWGWSPSQLNIDQIALSGANCVRIPWYQTPEPGTPQTTYSNLANLDSVLSKCIQYQLIPILDLHDLTCQNDTAALLSLANWYLQPDVLALIDKYKHSIILNVSNEVLFVNWTANPAASEAMYVNTHSAISMSFRNAGITVPIMVDGPDCGTNLDVLASVGATLQQNDPAHNTIFSGHAYWYAFAANDSAQMESKIDNAIASGIPFILGEIANQQDDQVLCQYNLNYQALLRICQSRNVGWLAWSWDNDGCADRQVTTNGNFASLTPYGEDILNNIDYGVHNFSPARSAYLFNGGFCVPSVANEKQIPVSMPKLYPNPSNGSFEIDLGMKMASGDLEVLNAAGQVVFKRAIVNLQFLPLNFEGSAGIYTIRISGDNRQLHVLKMVKI